MNRSEHKDIRGGTLRIKDNFLGNYVYDSNSMRKRVDFDLSSVDGDFINPNPFSFTKNEAYWPYVDFTYKYTDKGTGNVVRTTRWTGAAGENVLDNRVLAPPSTLDLSAQLNSSWSSAQARLANSIRNSDSNLAVSARESPELLKLKKQLNDGFSWRKVKRLAKKTPFLGAATLMSDAWLLWQFALKPTLNDAWNLATYISDDLSINPVVASASASVPINSRTYNANVQRYTQWKGNVKTKFKIFYTVKDAQSHDFARLGLSNPYLYAWERLPFSFVVDYVFNIGGYLSNVESAYARGLEFHSGFQTQTHKVSGENQYLPRSWEDSVTRYTSDCQAVAMRDMAGCNRTILTSFPTARVPSLDLDLGSGQLLNIAALLQSLFISRR